MTSTPHKAVIPNDYTTNLGTINTGISFNSMLNISLPVITTYITYVSELNINYTKTTSITNESNDCQINSSMSLNDGYKLHRFIRFIIKPNVTITNNNSLSDTNVSLNLTLYEEDGITLISKCSIKNIITLEPSMHALISNTYYCFILDTRHKTLSYEKTEIV